MRRLEEHLEAEAGSHGHGDRRHAIRLSGHFHVLLAEIAGNRVLERIVAELITRTSLIIGMFGGAGTDNCRSDEHLRMLHAIRTHYDATGAKLMFEHLAHIEGGLDLSRHRAEPVDVMAMLGGERPEAAS